MYILMLCYNSRCASADILRYLMVNKYLVVNKHNSF